MQELLARIAEIEDDDEPSVGLSNVTWLEDSMKLEIVVAVKYPRQLERWTVQCGRILSYEIKTYSGWPLLLTDNHPVLWQYRHDTAQAFFYGTPRSSDEAVGALYAVHTRALGKWIDFDTFFNSAAGPANMLKTGNGLLARGPVPLLEAYKQALSGLGVEVEIRFPRSNRIPGIQALIIGKSYIVGTSFVATITPDS